MVDKKWRVLLREGLQDSTHNTQKSIPGFRGFHKKLTNMKHVIWILFVILCACSDDEPVTDQGCMTGIPIGTQDRVLIKCTDRNTFLAGSNTSAGGTASWNQYTAHQWAKCDDCK